MSVFIHREQRLTLSIATTPLVADNDLVSEQIACTRLTD